MVMSKRKIQQSHHWYRDSRRAVKRAYGEDWKVFCGLLAATSPNCTVKANLTLARKAYSWWKQTGCVPKHGFMRAHWLNIHRVIQGKTRLGGRKVNSFYQNLLGNENPVTVDIWMMRMAGYILHEGSPRGYEYDDIEDRVKGEADSMGITPAGYLK